MGNKAVSDEDLRAELERLRQENAALKKGGAASGVRMQVSEKGAVSIYGMGRFPVTFYKEQWLKAYWKWQTTFVRSLLRTKLN
jgi:hypothetical protein